MHLQQRLLFATKHVLSRCENHHRICDAQKHLLHTHVKLKDKVINNYFTNETHDNSTEY